jgi:hypothetical protein
MQKKEHTSGSVPVTPTLSNEAIQNIAKVYADTNNTATFNNIRTTGEATINGSVTFNQNTNFKGGANPNNWQTHLPHTNGENYIRGPTNIDGYVKMNKGFEVLSPNGQFRLVLQDDGALALYKGTEVKWPTKKWEDVR